MKDMILQQMERSAKFADPNADKKRKIRVQLMIARVGKIGLAELERLDESLTDFLPPQRG
jgi:hypothetical protein|tara:strand:- start:3405 stop:3584 length:180 start_codon:yes stop_codon:yes gene_type:complete